ncbi:hypothetical protein [Streptomyces sp. NPDC088115]|uniref:hypothetical protein n=1 Tax=Streptomyces sp. NPDC088115 TaxID=3365824 RepID=UPI0037F1D758
MDLKRVTNFRCARWLKTSTSQLISEAGREKSKNSPNHQNRQLVHHRINFFSAPQFLKNLVFFIILPAKKTRSLNFQAVITFTVPCISDARRAHQ